MRRANSLENILMLQKIEIKGEEGGRRLDVRQHHRLNGLEFEQTPGDSEEQESLVCCSAWGHKELGMTQQLKNNNNNTNRQMLEQTYWWKYYLG